MTLRDKFAESKNFVIRLVQPDCLRSWLNLVSNEGILEIYAATCLNTYSLHFMDALLKFNYHMCYMWLWQWLHTITIIAGSVHIFVGSSLFTPLLSVWTKKHSGQLYKELPCGHTYIVLLAELPSEPTCSNKNNPNWMTLDPSRRIRLFNLYEYLMHWIYCFVIEK